MAARPSRAPSTGPRYFCIVYLGGGIDGVLTTDPKTRADLEPWADLPYSANEIVDGGGTPLGPHMAALAPLAPRLAILNGVQTRTVSHQTGAQQVCRMRVGISPMTPAIVDVLGGVRDGQPLGSLSLGALNSDDYSPGWFGSLSVGGTAQSLLDELGALTPDESAIISRALRAQAKELRKMGAQARGARAAENVEECLAFVERLPHVAPFKPEIWDPTPAGQYHALGFQRALWAIENDLVRAIYFKSSRLHWDTHSHNLVMQAESSGPYFKAFARFLGELEKRKNAFGTLADNTLVCAGGEVGRHPRLNHNNGKDHFPEAPFLFFGKGINAVRGKNVFGSTGRAMEARPISMATGLPEGSSRRQVDLTDIGTTLIHIAGRDPAMYGYNGEILRFLVKS